MLLQTKGIGNHVSCMTFMFVGQIYVYILPPLNYYYIEEIGKYFNIPSGIASGRTQILGLVVRPRTPIA
jgi:hypothetical protein